MVLIARLISVVVVTPILVLPGVSKDFFISIQYKLSTACQITVVLAGQTFAHVYLKAQLSVKRHSSVAQAPVLAHFGDAIAGIGEFGRVPSSEPKLAFSQHTGIWC